mgnify:CR=1 FL=1
MPAFTIVGLPDKAVAESRERVAALNAIGLALPPSITVNLAPADQPKRKAAITTSHRARADGGDRRRGHDAIEGY